MKNFDRFPIFAQNIDSGYSLWDCFFFCHILASFNILKIMLGLVDDAALVKHDSCTIPPEKVLLRVD